MKSFSLPSYAQVLLAKLGYVAGSILDALELLQTLLSESHKQNLHTETVQIFLDCEFFSTSLSVLSYFQHHVSLPLLNCVEKSLQSQLLTTFPQLYEDLKSGKIDTLKDFIVRRRHFEVKALTSQAENLLLKKFCESAAAVIKLQCGREYFPEPTDIPRATQLNTLSLQELEGLPTNNLKAERVFSHFDKRAGIAKMRNRRFKANSLRNDMTMLHRTTQIRLDEATKRATAALNARERAWNEEQSRKLAENDLKKKRSLRIPAPTKHVPWQSARHGEGPA